MPVQGLVRLRKHQFGRQLVPGTNVAATRAYPFSGVPEHELNWTDPEIDAGSRDITAPPFRDAPDLTASLEFPVLYYNNLPIIMSAFFGGDVAPTGGGTAKTWSWDPASETLDDPDLYTYEFGDDVLTDWFQDGDGILEGFEIAGPVGLGPLTASTTWRFGSVKSTGSTDSPVVGTVPTPALAVSVDDVIVYLKDGAIYIGDTPYTLESNQVSDALYSFTLTAEQEVDQKRWANGDQSFDTDAMVPGARTIELECRWAKTPDIVGLTSESDDWMSDQPVNRYVRMEFIATSLAQTPSTYYQFAFEMPMRYYTRVEDEEGGNSVVTLMGRAFYDPADFGGIFRPIIVNTLTEAQLGNAGSEMDVTIECICPPMADGERRHDRDTITFKDAFTYREAVALQKDMAMAGSDDDATVGDSLAALTEGYIIRGITAWTLVDARNKPIEVSATAIRGWLLSNMDVAMDVSAEAEELYNPAVLLPLVKRVSNSSATGPTDDSTSAPTALPRKPRKPSKPSSTSTTPTDDTATTTPSPAGDSRSSRNGTSVPQPV